MILYRPNLKFEHQKLINAINQVIKSLDNNLLNIKNTIINLISMEQQIRLKL